MGREIVVCEIRAQAGEIAVQIVEAHESLLKMGHNRPMA